MVKFKEFSIMNNQYPILIPIKRQSIRCPNKNRELLPFTINYLKTIQKLNSAKVITDCEDLEKYAISLGAEAYLEVREDNQDELLSCYNFLKNRKIKSDYFFLMPVTHPLRDLNLFSTFETKDKDTNIDFFVSVCSFTDRKNFFVKIQNDKPTEFLYENLTRKGQDCKQYSMIDGSLYLIKNSFLNNIIQSRDTNKAFWKGKFEGIINNCPFMDIDTLQDMEKFKYIVNFYI